jgi:hypothetical protein
MSQKRVFNQIETTVDFLIITLLGYYASSSQNPGGRSVLSLSPLHPPFSRETMINSDLREKPRRVRK